MVRSKNKDSMSWYPGTPGVAYADATQMESTDLARGDQLRTIVESASLPKSTVSGVSSHITPLGSPRKILC